MLNNPQSNKDHLFTEQDDQENSQTSGEGEGGSNPNALQELAIPKMPSIGVNYNQGEHPLPCASQKGEKFLEFQNLYRDLKVRKEERKALLAHIKQAGETSLQLARDRSQEVINSYRNQIAVNSQIIETQLKQQLQSAQLQLEENTSHNKVYGHCQYGGSLSRLNSHGY